VQGGLQGPLEIEEASQTPMSQPLNFGLLMPVYSNPLLSSPQTLAALTAAERLSVSQLPFGSWHE
jgi:hypothetical protein